MINFTRKAANSLNTLPEKEAEAANILLHSLEHGDLESIPPGKRPLVLKSASDKKFYVAKINNSLRLVFVRESDGGITVIDVMNHDRMASFFSRSDQEGQL